ncbi:MAG: hypothetical protein CMH49_08270 [Myxococcales bacterium]|nr:hypothetical protein [Myxococcales bacterium]
MPTYTFRGRDMSEAVEQVRIMLGSDAVIIDTLRGTDHIGRFVEITATGELKAPPTAPVPQTTQPSPMRRNHQGQRAPQMPPRGPTAMRGAAPRPPRMAPNRNAHIGAPSARDYDSSMPPPDRGGRRVRPSNPGTQHPAYSGRTSPSSHNGMPAELELLSNPPVKGADRYVHPNSFTTDRGPIIPQSVPLSHGHAQQVPSHASRAPNAPMASPTRRGMPRAHTPHPHPSPPHHMQYQQHPSSMPAASASQQLTPPINRRATPQVEHYGAGPESPGAYNPQGVDPWGLEQVQSTPVQQHNGSAQHQAMDLGQSVNAVRDIMSHNNGEGEAIQFVTERLNEIVNYIKSNQNPDEMSGPAFEHLKQFKAQLHGAGIEEKYAEELIEQTKARLRLNQLDKQYILAHLGQVLAHNLKCINPLIPPPGLKKNVLAFVGPTGVGKTTTIAKIAAHAQLTHELPVTLISTDTFRMAAVEQLSRYASILDCPAKAAHTPDEMWKAIDEADTPLVLVDTTGRNPKTQGQLKALSDLFGEGWNGRTVLTVAANTREQDLKPIVEGFSSLKYNMVAVTKLDETYALGTVYNVSKLTNCPISWTTNGQRVPEDIELANAEELAVKIIMEAIANK